MYRSKARGSAAKPNERSQGVEVTAPDGKRPLSLGEAASAQRLQLNQAGYYRIRLANGRQDLIGVNPDPKESNLDVIPDDVLTLWRGEGDQTSPEALGSTSASVQRKRAKRRGI